MSQLPFLLNVPTLAGLLGLTESGVRAMLRRGELPSFRLGRRWVVRREAFEAHMATLEQRQARRLREQESAADRLLRGLPRVR